MRGGIFIVVLGFCYCFLNWVNYWEYFFILIKVVINIFVGLVEEEKIYYIENIYFVYIWVK